MCYNDRYEVNSKLQAKRRPKSAPGDQAFKDRKSKSGSPLLAFTDSTDSGNFDDGIIYPNLCAS